MFPSNDLFRAVVRSAGLLTACLSLAHARAGLATSTGVPPGAGMESPGESDFAAGSDVARAATTIGPAGGLVNLAAVTTVTPFATGVTPVGSGAMPASSGCTPDWVPMLGPAPGMDGRVFAMTVFDDGSGPALYAGGEFTTAGSTSARHIAKWNGVQWEALGVGVDNWVNALAVFDDGSGPALYVGGQFFHAGGLPANGLAKWDGSSWSAVGNGVVGAGVFALTTFDDGSGPALFVGGWFSTAGSVPANNVAKWNGTSWSALGNGFTGGTGGQTIVFALTVFDSGSGPSLYAGGEFTASGATAMHRIARWNGSNWVLLGAGMGLGMNGTVYALRVFDSGSGPGLFVGGQFTAHGNNIARWSGTSWSVLGSGVQYATNALTVFDDGSGPALYAGGWFNAAGGVPANGTAKWNGTTWSGQGGGLTDSQDELVYSLASFDDGSGPALFAGGRFVGLNGLGANNLAAWRGSSWSALGRGVSDIVACSTVFDSAGQSALYAGGEFASANGQALNKIGKWDGTSWSSLAGGMNGWVGALTAFDDGSGPALYAGGYFTIAGGHGANRVARWNGISWSAVGAGVSYTSQFCYVRALAVFDDGSGLALYAGGQFTSADGSPANYIAKWNGTSWSPVGSGMNQQVFALAVFDDGTGPALYAGGDFTTAGGAPANRIARWDGVSWSMPGTGMSGRVRALTVFDDGSGSSLFAGGSFANAGGATANFVAKWNGTSWSALGNGLDGEVVGSSAFDDGNGSALYVGGLFTSAGGAPASNIARWDGSSWTALSAGAGGAVHSLTGFDDGSGAALYVGGEFRSSPTNDSHLAKWSCHMPNVGTGYCFGDGGFVPCPCGNSGATGNGCANSIVAAGGHLAATGVARVSQDTVTLAGTSMPSSSALYFQGTTQVFGGFGAAFGDGLRCVGGSVIRLGTKINVAGASSYPESSDQPIGIRGEIPAAGGTRVYQVWYRNAADFCTPSTFNLSNGLEIAWHP